ncbi:MAG: glycosyltransferase [Coriobacteriia bacterium]|nr:glycosyltransferase [Coriobacteriia bacterium]
MLVSNDVSIDARVRKEAETLANAGAQVTVIGLGEEPPEDIVSNAPYRLILAQPSLKGKPLQPRWGMPDVWYPVRVLVNTTVTKYRQKRYAEKIDESGYVSQVSRQDMIEAAAPLNFDVIHAHDLDTLYAGNRIAQEKGALLVYDSHELFTELHFLHPLVKEQCAIVEEEVFPHIDALVTVSPLIGQRLREKYQRFDLEPVVLYNGGVVVMDKVQPVADPVRLFFQGAFAPDRNLLELALAMKGLQGKATLSLQGWGPDEEGLRAIIEEYSLEDIVEIIPPCPPFDVVPSAARFDVGVINSIPEDENFLVTLPNKLFDYMSAGLAVASTDLPPIKEILTKEECGITYEQKGAEHTAEVLGNLVGNPEKILQMKKASLAAAPKYAWKAQAEKLIALYVDLRKEIDDERATRQ